MVKSSASRESPLRQLPAREIAGEVQIGEHDHELREATLLTS